MVSPEMLRTQDPLFLVEVVPVASERLADVWSYVHTELLFPRQNVIHADYLLQDSLSIAEHVT